MGNTCSEGWCGEGEHTSNGPDRGPQPGIGIAKTRLSSHSRITTEDSEKIRIDFAYVENYKIEVVAKDQYQITFSMVDESEGGDLTGPNNKLIDVQFTLRIDEHSECGLSGLPGHFEPQLLQSFSKAEVIEDPEKVMTAFVEGEIMKYGNSVF